MKAVAAELERADVQLRNQRLKVEQIDQAVNLYQGSMSLARIGTRFDVNTPLKGLDPCCPPIGGQRSPDRGTEVP